MQSLAATHDTAYNARAQAARTRRGAIRMARVAARGVARILAEANDWSLYFASMERYCDLVALADEAEAARAAGDTAQADRLSDLYSEGLERAEARACQCWWTDEAAAYTPSDMLAVIVARYGR